MLQQFWIIVNIRRKNMCLAVPGKIETVDEKSSPRMASVNFGGLIRDVCIEFLPEIKPGEYVIVHAGYALEKINEQQAEKQLKAFLEAEYSIISRSK